ncbi:glycosyltransferase 61 family protein [Paracoccus aestuariivivens]|uniref:DUF563 domain-containing protein n=1 Tax=Paracoccus aestuariivivens TaxID=1820333 RepID=A0A6L6J849_9RHOB|nr:glycosyltransferase family 61 protein [Paracoccus aestuariivivens]MTH76899.1 DUF563 domain-containing protein [Paracoccus aestuariivivens]
MLNAALISRNFARLLRRGPVDLTHYAVERHELCPAEETGRSAALYPEGAMDRIVALSPWRNLDLEMGLIQGTPIRHEATEVLVVPDVSLAGAYLYRGGAKERIGIGEAKLYDRDLESRRVIPEAHLVSSWMGADFFGNFMQDSLPLELVPPPDALRIVAPTKPYMHEAGYRALFDLPPPPMPRHAKISRLSLYRDFSQNSFKLARYNELRTRLRANLGEIPPSAGVFLRRGSSLGEPRRLLNEEAVIEFLATLGFDILDPERMGADSIARVALDAPVVVAVEGSHLGHAIYTLAAGGSLLVIQPPYRFAMPYKEVTDCMGMKFGFVVGLPAEGGFVADIDEIKQMLERLA